MPLVYTTMSLPASANFRAASDSPRRSTNGSPPETPTVVSAGSAQSRSTICSNRVKSVIRGLSGRESTEQWPQPTGQLSVMNSSTVAPGVCRIRLTSACVIRRMRGPGTWGCRA